MKGLSIARAFALCCAVGPGLAAAAACGDPGQWMVRVGGHNVEPSKTSNIDGIAFDVSSKAGVTFNVDYTFCKNFTVDLLLAAPFTHDINANGTKIGSTQQLPPTLTLQYHPIVDDEWDPYIGVGFNYTQFFNSNVYIPNVSLDLKNTFGYAVQTGLDYKIDKHWRVGMDFRYIQIEPDAYLSGEKLGTVKIDPYVYGATIGYAF